MRQGLAVSLAISAIVPASASAAVEHIAPSRPTTIEARFAIHDRMDGFAGVTNQTLTITRCQPAGKHSQSCAVRIGKVRYRVVVTDMGRSWWVDGKAVSH